MTIHKIDKYDVIEEIGRGGMGSVYKAIHPQFKKYVAIKEMRSDLAANPDIQNRFAREVEILAQIPAHPNIIMVRDALVWQRRLYLVMDYIEGETLARLLSRGPIAPDYAGIILDQVLSGLEAIHRRGIVHHDLKAGNILIDREGAAYISDFGIAELMGAVGSQAAMATPKAAAPELIDPRLGRGGLEQQVDIYAGGMLAYEMLLGEERFREAFPEVYNESRGDPANRWLMWHSDLSRSALNLSDVDPLIPRPLAGVVALMMAKDLNVRYKNAGDARRDLSSWLINSYDQRDRRSGPPYDDATVPIERVRVGGGIQRPAQQDYQPRQYEPPPQTPQPSGHPRQPVPAGKKIPAWVWWGAGCGAVLLLLITLLFILPGGTMGFTIVIKGAPPNSNVYIDNIRRGVTTADGSIRVDNLKTGTRLVKVSQDGYSDFNDRATGKDGEVKALMAQMAAVAPPRTITDIDYQGAMVLIPTGEFVMGDDTHETNERPSRKVNLPDYYIDKFEVSNAQYKKYCDVTGRPYPTKTAWNENYFNNYANSPVIGISFDEATSYASWAGKRLPTEEEWEKAAGWDPGANHKRQWPWGDSRDQSKAAIGTPLPAPTGQYSQGGSSYGVMDMAGNAAEWVDSYYQQYPGNPLSDPDYGTLFRVVRGGSFKSAIDECRTSFRDHQPPGSKADVIEEAGRKVEKYTSIGFRCVVSGNDPKLQDFLRSKVQ